MTQPIRKPSRGEAPNGNGTRLKFPRESNKRLRKDQNQVNRDALAGRVPILDANQMVLPKIEEKKSEIEIVNELAKQNRFLDSIPTDLLISLYCEQKRLDPKLTPNSFEQTLEKGVREQFWEGADLPSESEIARKMSKYIIDRKGVFYETFDIGRLSEFSSSDNWNLLRIDLKINPSLVDWTRLIRTPNALVNFYAAYQFREQIAGILSPSTISDSPNRKQQVEYTFGNLQIWGERIAKIEAGIESRSPSPIVDCYPHTESSTDNSKEKELLCAIIRDLKKDDSDFTAKKLETLFKAADEIHKRALSNSKREHNAERIYDAIIETERFCEWAYLIIKEHGNKEKVLEAAINFLKSKKWEDSSDSSHFAVDILAKNPRSIQLLNEEYEKAGREHFFTGSAKRKKILKIMLAVTEKFAPQKLLEFIRLLKNPSGTRPVLKSQLTRLLVDKLTIIAKDSKEQEQRKEAQITINAYSLLWDGKVPHSAPALYTALDWLNLIDRIQQRSLMENNNFSAEQNKLIGLIAIHKQQISKLNPNGEILISAFVGAVLEAQLKPASFVSNNKKDEMRKFLKDESNKEKFDYALAMVEPLFKSEFFEKLKGNPALIFNPEQVKEGLIF